MELSPRARFISPGGYGPNAQKPRARAELDGFTWWSTDTKTFEQVQWVGSLGRYAYQAVGDPRDSPSGPTNSLYETVPRDRVTTTVTQPSGTLVLYEPGIPMLYAGQKYSAANAFFTGVGSAVTHTWACLVRQSDRAILAVSPDTTAAPTANTIRTWTFSAAYEPENDTPFWLGICLVATTTVPPMAAAAAPTPASLAALAPVLLGTSNTAQTTPLALGTVVTAPTATATAIPYAYLT